MINYFYDSTHANWYYILKHPTSDDANNIIVSKSWSICTILSQIMFKLLWN